MYNRINNFLSDSQKEQIFELIHSPRIIFTSKDCPKCLRLKLLGCLVYASIRPSATINIIDAHFENAYVWNELLDIIKELKFEQKDFTKFVTNPCWGEIIFANGARIRKIVASDNARGHIGDFFVVDETHAGNKTAMDLIHYMCRHCENMQKEHKIAFYNQSTI